MGDRQCSALFFFHPYLNLQIVVFSLYPTGTSYTQLLSSVGIQFPSPLKPEQNSLKSTMVVHPLRQHSTLPDSVRLGPQELRPSPPKANSAVWLGFVEDPLFVLGMGFSFHKLVILKATEWKTHPIGVNKSFAISLKISKILSPI